MYFARSLAWITTYTGKKFHILDPDPVDVCLEDIAHALSMMCRFNGHVRRFYSVGEHCLHVSAICSRSTLIFSASRVCLTAISARSRMMESTSLPT